MSICRINMFIYGTLSLTTMTLIGNKMYVFILLKKKKFMITYLKKSSLHRKFNKIIKILFLFITK